eukprot:TRINITY_DN3921_c0_g1_i1.p1 TRINITY_DN3921_c0_g1~~TRINITY_DN3921_c0_g1_i1.p1  ORF type:complete len:146 (+),score=34.18 TRINITY_DN3921_c0_g1_i1:50-487(+)
MEQEFFSFDYNFEAHFGKSLTRNYAAYTAYLLRCHAMSRMSNNSSASDHQLDEMKKSAGMFEGVDDDQCLEYWKQLLQRQQEDHEFPGCISGGMESIGDRMSVATSRDKPEDNVVDNPFSSGTFYTLSEVSESVSCDYGDQFLSI